MKIVRKPEKYIIGIDEVGRGPLAGPVTVCALALPKNFFTASHSPLSKRGLGGFLPLRDSKKLSQKQREQWLRWINENSFFPRKSASSSNPRKSAICYSISDISPKIIDKINISQAANLAATRCVIKLVKKYKLPPDRCEIKLDGGLKLIAKSLQLKAKSYIKGDELIPAISLASIVAKVHRDKLMEKLDKKYPQYGFEKHKGYGTKLHYKNIKKFGISEIHRLSFLKNI